MAKASDVPLPRDTSLSARVAWAQARFDDIFFGRITAEQGEYCWQLVVGWLDDPRFYKDYPAYREQERKLRGLLEVVRTRGKR